MDFLRGLFVWLGVVGRLGLKVFTWVLSSHMEVLLVLLGLVHLLQETDGSGDWVVDHAVVKKFGG